MRQTTNGYEQIQSYTHFPGIYIDVFFGAGQVVGDAFKFDENQSYKFCRIVDITEARQSMTNELIREANPDYSNLIAKTNGAINEESLWEAIDLIKARR
jgi:hypothetical protein